MEVFLRVIFDEEHSKELLDTGYPVIISLLGMSATGKVIEISEITRDPARHIRIMNILHAIASEAGKR